jgi:MoxR-like ATPase
MVHDVMRHRIVLSFESLSDDVTSDNVLATVLKRVPAPVVPLREASHARLGA